MQSLDAVGDHDVGVQMRVTGAGVVMVVAGRDQPGDVGLDDGAVPVRGAGAGSRDLAFHEGEYLVDRLVVRLGDQRLRARVGHCPQRRDRLRHGEREVEPGNRMPGRA